MATTIDLLRAEDAPRWDAYVNAHPHGTLFHSTRWHTLLERIYSYEHRYLYALEGGEVKGVIPLVLCGSRILGRALVALPFAGTQPSVCADDATTEAALVDYAVDLARREELACVELREADHKPWALEYTQTYVNIKLGLSADPEQLWVAQVDGRVRTKVRAARKRGLQASWHRADGVEPFFAIYADTMHRLGSPPHSKNLFRELFVLFPENSEILLVNDGARPVAGAIVLHDECWIGFPWAASLTDARHKHPNNLLYWSIIDSACRRGYSVLDLGRSPRDSGTQHFKQQFGGMPTLLWYYFGLATARHVPRRDASDRMMIMASRLWRHLPVPVANAIGPALARLIP